MDDGEWRLQGSRRRRGRAHPRLPRGAHEQSLVGRRHPVSAASQVAEGLLEVRGHAARVGVAVLRLPPERAGDDRAELLPLRSPREQPEIGVLVDDLEEDGDDGVRAVGLLPRDELVEDEAHGKEVAPPVQLSRPRLLGGHVVGRPHEHVLRRLHAHEAGHPEVHDLCGPPGGQEDVRGLDVAVDDPAPRGRGRVRRGPGARWGSSPWDRAGCQPRSPAAGPSLPAARGTCRASLRALRARRSSRCWGAATARPRVPPSGSGRGPRRCPAPA